MAHSDVLQQIIRLVLALEIHAGMVELVQMWDYSVFVVTVQLEHYHHDVLELLIHAHRILAPMVVLASICVSIVYHIVFWNIINFTINPRLW